jgi:hypothetical protein
MDAPGSTRSAKELQNALGRDGFRLTHEQAISHLDDSPVHLVTDAALSWLGDAVTGVDARRVPAQPLHLDRAAERRHLAAGLPVSRFWLPPGP